MEGCISAFGGLTSWTPEAIKDTAQACTQAAGLKSGEAMPLLRKVLTGREKGVKLPLMIALLGKEEVNARLKVSEKSATVSSQ